MKTRVLVVHALLMAFAVGSFPLLSAHSTSQKDLAHLDQEIALLRQQISELRGESQTLENELQILAHEMERTELTLERLDIEITALEAKVADVTAAIEKQQEEIARTRAAIAQILLAIYKTDQIHPVVRLVDAAQNDLGAVFDAASADTRVNKALFSEIQSLQELIVTLEQERFEQTQTLGEQEELQRITGLAREELLAKQKMRADLLSATRGRQSEFEKIVASRQKDAARILTELYFLEDLGRGLPFEQALQLATTASQATGVRPALLLAVLQKESHLGASVGTGNWKNDMHPRDWDAFFQITQELGLDPDTTPVSRKPDYGWGGAMGPSQFLPSTWLGWKDRIAQITGHNPPSPWDISDAFVGTGLKLGAAGATVHTYETEWKAAMMYFAGGNWDKPQYGFYGDSVMALADYFQEQINILEEDTLNKKP